MSDPPRTASGTLKSECPKCHDAGAVDPACDVCDGTGHCGLAHAVEWMLGHGKTDPPPSNPPPTEPEL